MLHPEKEGDQEGVYTEARKSFVPSIAASMFLETSQSITVLVAVK